MDPIRSRTLVVKALLVLSLFLGTVSLLEGISWIGKVRPGFTISQKGEVTSLMHSRWTGNREGIKRRDQILAYDGVPFTTVGSFFQYLEQNRPVAGSKEEFAQAFANTGPKPVVYQIDRKGRSTVISVHPMLFTWDDYLLSFFLDLFIGLSFVLLAVVIFFFSPHVTSNFLVCLAGFLTGLMQILAVDYYTGQLLLLPLFVVFCLFALVSCQANFEIFRKRSPIKISLRAFNITLAGVFVLSGLVYFFAVRTRQDHQIYAIALMLSYALPSLVAHANCAFIYFTTDSVMTRKIIRLFNLIYLTILPAYAYYAAREIFDVILPRELLIFQLWYAIFLPLTIIRFHALDFNVRLKRGTLALLVGVILVGNLLLVCGLTPAVLRAYQLPPHYALGLMFLSQILMVVFLLYAAHTSLFDRIFFYSTYKFKNMIESAGDSILSKLSTEDILNSLGGFLAGSFQIPRYFFYLGEGEQDPFVLSGPAVCVPEEIEWGKIEMKGRECLILSEMESAGDHFVREMLVRNDLVLLLPILFCEKTIGLAFLSEKSDHSPYSPEDIINLQTLLKTAAAALVNARQHDAVLKLQERLKIENRLLKEEVRGGKIGDPIIGERGDLRDVFQNIEKIRESDVTVLLRGESGVGKELIARAIHDRSSRGEKPFIAINCTAIPEALMESELFGYEKGAFTDARAQKIGLFEAAHEGTIFLDEIGDVNPAMQLKFLRVLQEREIKRVGGNQSIPVDVRVIAATNRDLEAAVAVGQMRKDLYFRLNVFPVYVPPLRERKKDLQELVYSFVRKFSEEMGKAVLFPDKESRERLLRYPWPGNVRELQNVIERSVALCPAGEAIKIHDLEGGLWDQLQEEAEKILRRGGYHQQMEEFQRRLVKRAIHQAGGNKARAARTLGIHVTHLYKMMKQLEKN
ncbi:MAG: sigma-54-dependent Fis family transcriptional regulator [Deltaproteobacteria bacterium]|nr:sigma-54-dependent Fis family transcriptional regulator [Deltaproteobacteria bacterium]